MSERMTRTEIEQNTLRLVRRGGGTRPDVRVIERNGHRQVAKDYRACAPFFRLCFGRLLVRREVANYRRLQGVLGVPRLESVVDPYCFLIEWVDGQDCAHIKRGQLSADYFELLRRLLDALHVAGVVHCDLKYRDNIMVVGGRPYLVDFVAAFTREGSFGPLRRWLYRQFLRNDEKALAKLKAELAPDLVTDDERNLLAQNTGLEIFAHLAVYVLRAMIRLLAPGGRKHRRRLKR